MTRFALLAALSPGAVRAGVVEEATELVALGPRVAGTEGGDAAQAFVRRRLEAAGYVPIVAADGGGGGAVLGCQEGPDGAAWVMAHTDAVHRDCPGAVDNAGAVALALELARDLREVSLPRPACFVFPDGEEVGLRGSRNLAGRYRPSWVVSLELIGRGRPTAMGLGPGWGTAGLRWLSEQGELAIPWAYRVHSLLLPGGERSDHAPFAARGILAFLVLERPPGGVYWPYHTAQDLPERLDPSSLDAARRAVEGLLRSEPPRQTPDAAMQVPWSRRILSGTVVWTSVVLGAVLGLSRVRGSLKSLGWGLAATLSTVGAGGLAWSLALHGRPGQGALAGPGVLAWAAIAVAVAVWFPVRPGALRGGAVGLGLGALALSGIEPVLALPLGLGAGGLALATWWRPAALLTLPLPLYLTCPSSWRELVFHRVLDPSPWVWLPVLALLWWGPLCGWLAVRWRPRRPWLLAALAAVVVAWAALAPTWTETWFDRAELLPGFPASNR